jgi:hypothetical protein
VSGHVEVKNTSACNFHHHEYIDRLESCRHDVKEVTGDDRFGVVAHERHPALLWVGGTFGRFGHVAPNRAGRDADSDFQQQFIGNALFAPSWIAKGYFPDKLSDIGGHLRATARPRFPFPKQTAAFAMPPNQRVGLDDNESLAPIKPAGQSAESESDGAGSPAWFDFSLDEQTELFAQEWIFCCDGGSRTETESQKAQGIQENAENGLESVLKQFYFSILLNH